MAKSHTTRGKGKSFGAKLADSRNNMLLQLREVEKVNSLVVELGGVARKGIHKCGDEH